MSSAASFSKEELAIRKTVTESLRSLVTYSAKHIDQSLAEIIRIHKNNNSTSQSNGGAERELSKSHIKTIQAESQKRLDLYTKLTNECLQKRDPATLTVASITTAGLHLSPSSSSSAKDASSSTTAPHQHSALNKFTAFTIRSLSDDEANLKALSTLLIGYVKYCDLLSNGAEVYAEPSDEDEDEAERKKNRAAMSSEDRNRAVLSRMMCEEGRMLTGLISAILFVNSNVRKLEREIVSLIQSAAAAAAAKGKGATGGGKATAAAAADHDGDASDALFKTVTLTDYSKKSAAAATASTFIRCFPNADSLVGLLDCSSDPATQLAALRIITALVESDPVAAIPFIASVENGVSTIGQFVNKERVADHCGSASNMCIKIQSSAVSCLCELTNPIAIDAAQKADAAAGEGGSGRSGGGAFEGGTNDQGGTDSSTNNRSSVSWLGMSGTLQRVIQGALAFDDCLKHLFALAMEHRGAFARDEIAAGLSETVAKTALAVPLLLPPEGSSSSSPLNAANASIIGYDGMLKSPHPSVARSEGSLTLVRKIATVILNILKGNHQTTNAFLQMSYLEQTAVFFHVPPPFAAQCGDENLAPLPFFARNKGTRSASQVPSLGMELLLPTACDIVLQCLETGAHDQQRLNATASASSFSRGGGDGGSAPQSLDGSFTEVTGGGANTRHTAPSAQNCIDQLFHRSFIMKAVLHHISLIGSVAAKADMIALVNGGMTALRQLNKVLLQSCVLVRGQTRTCVEWVLRNDCIAPQSAISVEMASGYYGAALLPYSPEGFSNQAGAAGSAATSPAGGGSSSSSFTIGGNSNGGSTDALPLVGGGGRTAVATLVEDACLRVPPRGSAAEATAIPFLALLLNTFGASSSSAAASPCPTPIAEQIALSLLRCVRMPNATPQALGIRQLATVLLPQLQYLTLNNTCSHVSGGGGPATSDDDGGASSPTRGAGANTTTIRPLTAIKLVSFIGDQYLHTLLAIPTATDAPPTTAARGGTASGTATPRNGTTPRGSIVGSLLPPAGPSSSASSFTATVLGASSPAAAALFCLALLDVVAGLEHHSEVGSGLGRDELALLETAIVSKAIAMARASFEADGAVSVGTMLGYGSSLNATNAASKPVNVGEGAGGKEEGAASSSAAAPPTTLRATVLADRLLAFVLLGALQHHDLSQRVEARIVRGVKDVLSTSIAGMARTSEVTVRGARSGAVGTSSNNNHSPTDLPSPSKQRTTSSAGGGGGGGTASGTTSRSNSPRTSFDEGSKSEKINAMLINASAHNGGGAGDDASLLGLLIDMLCGPASGVRQLLQSRNSADVDEGVRRFASVLNVCTKGLTRGYAHGYSCCAAADASASSSSSSSQLNALASPFTEIIRMVRASCYAPSSLVSAEGQSGVVGGGGAHQKTGPASVNGRTHAMSMLSGKMGANSVTSAAATSSALQLLTLVGSGSNATTAASPSHALLFAVMRDVVLRFVQTQVHSDDEDNDEEDGGAGGSTSSVKFNVVDEKATIGGGSQLKQVTDAAAVLLLARRKRRIELMFPSFE